MTAGGDAITLATAIRPRVPLAKALTVSEGGTPINVEPSPNAFLFAFHVASVKGLDDLAEVLREAAADPTEPIVVWATPKAPEGRRAIYDDDHKGPAGLEVVPRLWCAFDWDGLPLLPQTPTIAPELIDDPAEFAKWSLPDPLLDPEIGVQLALNRLPPPFRAASCIWQLSASAGVKDGFRLRTWHWLDHPTTGAKLKTWLGPAIEAGEVDPVTLVEAQPHYIGVRVVGGPDPASKGRWGIVCGERDTVAVPDIGAIELRQQERDRIGSPFRPQPAAGLSPGDVEARLANCLEAIRSASARHPTYKAEAARAYALCERYGVDWAPIRQRLIDVYESTLSASERRQRRKSSTLGVVEWLEQRRSAA